MSNPPSTARPRGASLETADVIDELFNLRAMALAAKALIDEDPKDGDRSLNAGRVMQQLADLSLSLANRIDGASLAKGGAR